MQTRKPQLSKWSRGISMTKPLIANAYYIRRPEWDCNLLEAWETCPSWRDPGPSFVRFEDIGFNGTEQIGPSGAFISICPLIDHTSMLTLCKIELFDKDLSRGSRFVCLYAQHIFDSCLLRHTHNEMEVSHACSEMGSILKRISFYSTGMFTTNTVHSKTPPRFLTREEERDLLGKIHPPWERQGETIMAWHRSRELHPSDTTLPLHVLQLVVSFL